MSDLIGGGSAPQTSNRIYKASGNIVTHIVVMVSFVAFAFIALYGALSVSAITPSDLPECAVDCYIQGIANVGLAFNDFEGQCRSSDFQYAMRGCVAMECQYDEYLFVTIYDVNILMADRGCRSKILS
jgi:hypothetical protein